VSSGTDAGDADMTTSLSRIFDFYVFYKLHAVDTEVDPPQRNSRSWIFETEGVRKSSWDCLTLTAAAQGGACARLVLDEQPLPFADPNPGCESC